MEIIITTPALDEIEISRWFTIKYYTFEQQDEIINLLHNHVWITARKEQIFVRTMTTAHILNCINCWEGKGKSKIPKGYLGGKDKWLAIFNQELINRI